MRDDKRQPSFKIYNPEKEVKDALAKLQRQQKIISGAMVAVIVVVTLGFIAMIVASFSIFIDHQNYLAEKYTEYAELLKKQKGE